MPQPLRLFARNTRLLLSRQLYKSGIGRQILPTEFYPSLIYTRRSELLGNPSEQIAQIIRRGKPAMVARFGSVELRWLIQLRRALTNSQRKPSQSDSSNNLQSSPWPSFRRQAFQNLMDDMPENALRFLAEYESAMRQVDLLAAWAFGESYFSEQLREARLCHLDELEPWLTPTPWSAALADKRVVVVHPFKETIAKQYYERRLILFDDSRVLPQFYLRIVQAFMPGVRDYPEPGGHFFEKIDTLLEEIHDEPFDVAIIGSGANGFLIASEVKKRGGIALHLGGLTQLIFGIRGKRWEDFGFPFFNEHWVRPLPTETPANYAEHYDKGAYW